MNKETPKPGTLYAGGNWIMAYSGTYVDVFNPAPEMFLIEDIAEGLAYNYRWGGHSKSKITVAEHSIKVALCLDCTTGLHTLSGLLHDASEAYLGDMASPIKKDMPGYKEVEHRVMVVIAAKFGFAWPMPVEVHNADALQLASEWNFCVMAHASISMTPDVAKVKFLEWFELLSSIKKTFSTPDNYPDINTNDWAG
jgi:hypothetical protein